MESRTATAIAKLAEVITGLAIWLSFVIWSGWLEFHGQHDRAVWVMLLVIANSLGWLKSIEINTDRIPEPIRRE